MTRVGDYIVALLLLKHLRHSVRGLLRSADLSGCVVTFIDLEAGHVEVGADVFGFGVLEVVGDVLERVVVV